MSRPRTLLAVLAHRLAHEFRQRHGLPDVPGLVMHDAMHEILGEPPTVEGELRVLFVQGIAQHVADSVPEGHPLRALRHLVDEALGSTR